MQQDFFLHIINQDPTFSCNHDKQKIMGVDSWVKCPQKKLTMKTFGRRKVLVFSSPVIYPSQKRSADYATMVILFKLLFYSPFANAVNSAVILM